MTILKITSDIPRHSEDYTRFPDPSFDLNFITGGFDTEIADSFNIVKTPYSPSKGDKIYFLPSVSVPRVKFKNVCVEFGVKTIRDVEQANVIFGSKKSISDITTYTWAYKCKTENFKALIKRFESEIDGHDLEKIETALEFYNNEVVALDYNLYDWVINIIGNEDSENRYSNRLSMVKEEYVDLFNALQGKEILDEASVINVLNGEDATEIDKSMFEHLSDMFESSDTDNHVLAMEIMANSKYVESLIYLELLFHKYAHKISDRHTKNHVNFKSLISYLDKDKSYLNTDIDDIAKSLVNKDQFTTDKLEIIMEYLSSHIQSRGDSKYFTVKTITVHPDHIAQLGSNYTYEVQTDYINPEKDIDIADEEERVSVQDEIIISEEDDELIGEAFARVERADLKEQLVELEKTIEPEPITEQELAHDLYGVDNEDIEVTLQVRTESNNNQTETNDTNDFEWF